MEIDLLGRFAVRRDGREIDAAHFGGRLSRRLVRVLAAQRGRPVSRDALIEALWEDTPPNDPAANLNALVNRARRALEDSSLIATVPGGYVLDDGAGVVVDVERFESYAGQARRSLASGDPRGAVAAAEAGLELWAGEPLAEDEDARWARPVRDRLLRMHQETLECGAAGALEAGEGPRAVDLASEAVSRQPLREVAHLLLVRALAAVGDQAAALSAYDSLRATLAEELGIDPSPDAAALQQRLLRGGLTRRAAAPGEPRGAPPLLGRDEELSRLLDLGPGHRLAILAGRSGSGKSRLLAELRARSETPTLTARAVLPERETPWSLTRTILAAATDLGLDPDTCLPPRAAGALADLLPGAPAEGVNLEAQSRRALVLHAAARLLRAPEALTLLVDDLQWADSSSLDLLRLLAERGDQLVLVVAYRPEEVAEASPVQGFLRDLAAVARPEELALGPLPADAINRLVGRQELAATLAEHTDGTPFALLEVIRELSQAGDLRRDPSGVWQPVSPEVTERARDVALTGKQRAIWGRAEREPRGRRELLGLMSLLGRPAPASLLARTTGRAVAEILEMLDALDQSELVRHDARGFGVAHDLVGETLRGRLGTVERARLHQLLARALAEDGAPAEELARHLAGAGDVPAAGEAYSVAAQERLEHHADREAEQLAEEGLALATAPESRASLLETRAQTRARRGDLSDAGADLRAALALADQAPVRSRLFARMAALRAGSDDLLRAANLAELAITEARDDAEARARALYVAALVDMNLEEPLRAEQRFAEALALFEQVGDSRGVADILDARAMAQFMGGDISGGVAAFARVADLFADSGNLLRVVTPRSTRGHGLLFAGEPEAARAETEVAVDLARGLGYSDGEAMALWHHSEALAACGELVAALDCADDALATARRVGHRGWTATAQRARGIALTGLGDLAGAEAAFRASLEGSEHFLLISCWAHARLASLLVRTGRLDEAETHVERALAAGPPLARYEARLARCELAVADARPVVAELVEDAIDQAEAGGHRVSVARLRELRR